MPGAPTAIPFLVFFLLNVLHSTDVKALECLALGSVTSPLASVSNCSLPLAHLGDDNSTRQDVMDSILRSLSLKASGDVVIADVTVHVPQCAQLWALTVRECSFQLSASWPSHGLEAGRTFLYYRRMVLPNVLAERVNITCPLDHWDELSTASNQGQVGTVVPLQPCGTATVYTGQQLVEALERLQANHSRVLVTLASNISLPASPTPQRLDPAPDDSQPLVRIYRTVTITGNGPRTSSAPGSAAPAASATELNVKMRRNAFDLRDSGGRQQPQYTSGVSPLLILTDLQIVNGPPGAPSTWPTGLVRTTNQFVGMTRDGTGRLQLLNLRMQATLMKEELGYLGFWQSRVSSSNQEDRDSATWFTRIATPLFYTTDEDGYQSSCGILGNYIRGCNFSLTAIPLATPSIPSDFSPWPLVPPAPPASPSPPLPAANFAVAMNTTSLLGLLQERWIGSGQRVIFVLNNVTLVAGQWPQGGAVLSYNLTLLGPVAGDPVWLDAGGLELAKAAVGAGSDTRPVTVQLHRLRLLGFPAALIRASLKVVAMVAAATTASEEYSQLQDWSDRCEDQMNSTYVVPSLTVSDAATLKAPLLYELRNCTLELPEATAAALVFVNSELACVSSRVPSPASTSPSPTQAAAAQPMSSGVAAAARVICGQGPGGTTGHQSALAVVKLLDSALTAVGQVTVTDSGGPIQALPAILLSSATLGDVTFVNTSVRLASASAGERNMSDVADVTGATEASACSLDSLVLALSALPVSWPSVARTSDSGSRQAAIIGGVIGAAAGVTLLCVAAVALLTWRRRTQQQLPLQECGPKDTQSLGAQTDTGGPPQEEGPVDVGAGVPCGADGPAGGATETAPAVTASASPQCGNREEGFGGDLTWSMVATGDEVRLGAGGDGRSRPPRTLAEKMLLGETAAAGQRAPPVSPGEVQPGSAQCAPGSTGNLVDDIHRNIRNMMRQCQAAAAAVEQDGAANADAISNGSKAQRLKLLGRGGYGAVYLGEWRGLPAAIKVVMYGMSDCPGRLERLTREVALTRALSHPNVVPTYDHTLDLIRPGGGPAREDEVAGALHLQLVMQYCEGGTLGAALKEGMFRRPLEPLLTQASAPASAWLADAGHKQHSPPAQLPVLPVLPVPPRGVDGEAPSPWVAPPPDPSDAAPTGAVPPGLLTWDDLRAAGNLPHALLAALDVARGLEYLHARHVVHGDLTENNVLLKAVVPVLPPRLDPGVGTAAVLLSGRSSTCGPVDTTSNRIVLRAMTFAVSSHSTGTNTAADASVQGEISLRPTGAPEGGMGPTYLVPASPSPGTLQRARRSEEGIAPQCPTEPAAMTCDAGALAMSSEGTRAAKDHGGNDDERSVATENPSPDGMGTCAPLLRVSLQPLKGDSRQPLQSTMHDRSEPAQAQPRLSESPIAPYRLHRACIASPCDSTRAAGQQPAVRDATAGDEAARDFEAEVAAGKLLAWMFKISDLGLSIQMSDPNQTHISNMTQGTPVFAAPEVVLCGRLSPAADIYSFGVLLWLLLHGVALGQLRHLLPRVAHIPAGPILLRRAARTLPGPARELLQRCLAYQPAHRPTAADLRATLEQMLAVATGTELSYLLLEAQRREHITPTLEAK